MLVLSNLVSNVPAVLLLRPVVNGLLDSHFIWLSLAATSITAIGIFTLEFLLGW